MGDHIRKTQDLLQRSGIEEPVIGYGYVKISPVPKELEYLLKLEEEELEGDGHVMALTEIATSLTALLSNNFGKHIRSRVVTSEGSLILIVAIAGYIAQFFKPEIKAVLHEIAKQEGISKKEAAEAIRKFMRGMLERAQRLGTYSRALRVALLDNLDQIKTSDSYQTKVHALGRTGVFSNWAGLDAHLNAALNPLRTMEDRTKSIKSASRQLDAIAEVAQDSEDQQLLLDYLRAKSIVRPFVRVNERGAEKYNKSIDYINQIIGKLEKVVDPVPSDSS